MAINWFMIAFGWASLGLLTAGVILRLYRYASMPISLRWEVYPIPHETKERRSYGGSYMEQVDWVKRPKSSSLWAELVEMASEILLFKRVRIHNRYGLWPFSFVLHWGIYLLVLWLVFLAVSSLLPFSSILLNLLIVVTGLLASALGIGGTAGLIVKRATNRDLAQYTTLIDYVNLVFLAAIFGLGFLSWLVDPQFLQHQAYIGSLIRFKPVPVSTPVASLFLLLQLFGAYMPFSRMIHTIIKHFTFRETLWDHHFMEKGSSMGRRIEEQLAYEVTWAGPHMAPGKRWLEGVQSPAAGQEREP